ncbi:MAG: Globin-coupled histidine kinase [Anaerolineales bacterium]|nr:Globin-coupled histidine kinase [Anaerolineales bacterium]
MNDRKSWEIKDEAILADLVALMGLTDEEKSAMAACKSAAEAQADPMIEAFYQRLLNQDITAEFLEGMVEHLRSTLKNWFITLFSGEYDEAYVKSRLAIGKTHVRIGLPVRYPLAMMDILMEHGEKVANSQGETAVKAFRKLAALDIAIFNQAYEDTHLNHLAELVGNERLARRLLTR